LRGLSKVALREGFLSAAEYTKALLADLSDRQLNVAWLPIVNPFLWEYGHVAWFTENFWFRWKGFGEPRRPSMLPDADRWDDSSRVEHHARQALGLPDRARRSLRRSFIAGVRFGTHCVLRGASFATPPRLHHLRFRNFFLPERDDIFVGFRTCAAA